MPEPFITMELEGAAELEAALRALGTDRLIKATMRRALLEAATRIAADAQARAPRQAKSKAGRPHMADKIAASATLSRRQRAAGNYKSDSDLVAYVFVGASPTGPAVEAEFGTGPRMQKNGKSTGAEPAHPFMRPAWEAGKMDALAYFMEELGKQIEASATRLAKRQAKLIAQGNRG